eukprot:TRINITY_DN48386_c0_g1_i1.p1 TRINITY_DN48386_c0_g1~~TRINITY_DN48386_c0_g1_i1.p1  ORF type:complete len:655 (-),score=70.70 TRINITY_DN48386_c0_g1_i1:397-2361(-)
MQLDSILSRYFSNIRVAEWLFARHDLKQVNAKALDNACVYTIGFRPHHNVRSPMDIEDMLIVHAIEASFVLGVVYGLGKPHIFAETPFMAGQRPVTRRFAVDLSVTDALEFMETNYFADGKMAVIFRRFLHTNDGSLPVVVAATLHQPCDVPYTLGALIMSTDVFEAPQCPNCGRCGKRCKCSFDSYAPTGAIKHNCFSWNQFSSMFLSKAQHGLARIRITARLPNMGDVLISHNELPVRTVIDRGHGTYITLLKRKAVQGLGLDVVPVRLESPLLSSSLSNDFLDLHNHYVVRKRQRQPDPHEQAPAQSASAELQDELQTIDLSEIDTACNPFPAIGFKEMQSLLGHADDTLAPSHSIEFDMAATTHSSTEATPNPLLPELLTPSILHNRNNVLPEFPQVTTLASPTQPPPSSTDVEATKDIVNDIEDILKARMSLSATQAESTAYSNALMLKQRSANNQISASVMRDEESHQPSRDKPPKRSSKKARTSSSSLSSSVSGDSDTSARKNACSTCSARFKMRGDLLRHIRTVHEGKKRYQCPRCPKAFGHSGHLNRHIQSVHLQQRRFKCEICGFQFFQASHLQSHMNHVHNPNKPFQCTDCGVRVNSEVALRSHRSKTKCGAFRGSNVRLRSDLHPPISQSRNTGSQGLPMKV